MHKAVYCTVCTFTMQQQHYSFSQVNLNSIFFRLFQNMLQCYNLARLQYNKGNNLNVLIRWYEVFLM